jgi:hypothetical protein
VSEAGGAGGPGGRGAVAPATVRPGAIADVGAEVRSDVGADGGAEVSADVSADVSAGDGPHAEAPQARRGRASIVVAALLAVLFLAAAWFAARRGIITDTWPAFLPGTDSTSIIRYSGPWLTAAAAAVLGAGLSVMALLRGLTTRPAR